MKVKELIDLLNAYCDLHPSTADREITIMVKPSNGLRIGINNGVEIDTIIQGFDWSHNYMFILPKKDVVECVKNSFVWNDSKVIDFVNWFIELHKLDFKYTLENICIIDSFKNGDDAKLWHNTTQNIQNKCPKCGEEMRQVSYNNSQCNKCFYTNNNI